MNWLVLLPLLSIASCAPVGEQADSLEGVDDRAVRVKKAKEFMMFDKEPNSPKETQKRSDPSMFNEASVDIDGQVQANNPVDLPNEDESYNEAESAINESEEAVSQEESDSKEELVADETDVGSEEITDVAESNEIPTDLDETSDEDEMNYDAYLKELEDTNYYPNYMKMLGQVTKPNDNAKWGPLYDEQYINFPTRFQRFRRSQNRRFNNVPILRRAVKRTRRIKRDLFYPNDGLAQEYDPYGEEYLMDPYETYEPSGNEDLVTLLDLLDNARAYDEINYGNYGGNGYEWPDDELDDMVYEEEPTYYVPKRQAGLTFVPGIKRARPFYPYFEEPQSHFKAFVPQKRRFRDYEDEYERVMRLAAALRDEAEYPEEYAYPVYRRK